MPADEIPIEDRQEKESLLDSTPTDPLLGKIIDGCRIEYLIARGGMGRVYRARHLVLGKDVAMKILSEDMAFDKEYISRFLTEAKIAAQLDHPNIIQIHDVGKEQGVYFIHMQFVDGDSVGDLIERRRALDEVTALRIVGHTAAGLSYAHKRNIIHRDIKPGNIMVDKAGQIKIADFGLAKSLLVKKGHTASGQVLGTPYFMSPEQCRGVALDARTDQYSLGATLYYMISGAYPFDADETLTVLRMHLEHDVSFDGDMGDMFSPSVKALIERMMSKDPAERYESTEDLTSDILITLKNVVEQKSTRVFDESKIMVLPLEHVISTTTSAKAETRPCPYCAEPVRAAAAKCMYCGESISMDGLIPFGKRITGLICDLLITVLGARLLHQPHLAWLIGFPIYFTVMLAFNSGQTLGMMLMGHRIVQDNGKELDLNDAVKRTLYMLLSFALFGSGFLLPLLREDKKTLHDLMSNTKAVPIRKAALAGEKAGK